MEFPVWIPLGPLQIHPHFLFETLAYFLGFRLYLRQRRQAGDHLTFGQRMSVVCGAAVGAAVGSKLLYWFEDPAATLAHLTDPAYLMAGKTIVGGLLGGLIGVELTKKWIWVTRSTGDLFAVPLAAAISIGRIGCFLTGLSDHTHGVPTSLPWGVDFGDGILRHPVQLYEIGALAILAAWLIWRSRRPHREGDLFKGFMIGYLGFRLLVDFIKPGVFLAGLTGIQWACLAALLYYRRDLPHVMGWRPKEAVSGG